MSKLLRFQFVRLRNTKLLFLLPFLLVVIGVAGMVLGSLLYEEATAELRLLAVYNSYSQFTFIFLLYLYVSTFTKDYQTGSYTFIKQLGYGVPQNLATKTLWLWLISALTMNTCIILSSVIIGNTNLSYLGLVLITANLTLLYTILFSLVISVYIKKTMTAVLLGFVAFVVFDIANVMIFGITNPADGNSISYAVLAVQAGLPMTHSSLADLNIDYEKLKYVLVTVPTLVWIALLLALLAYPMRKDRQT